MSKSWARPSSILSLSERKAQSLQKLNPQKNRYSSYRQRQERRRKSFYDRRRNTANVVPTYSDVSNITEAINGMEAIEETGEEVSVINENQINDAEMYACNSYDLKSIYANGLLIHISSVHDITGKTSATTKGAL